MPCCALSWVRSCPPQILISMIVGTVSGHRAMPKTTASTIMCKNKSNQYKWDQGSEFSLLVARVQVGRTSSSGGHRYLLTY